MSSSVVDDRRPVISADEFDRLFDDGEVDILQYCDLENARRPGLEARGKRDRDNGDDSLRHAVPRAA